MKWKRVVDELPKEGEEVLIYKRDDTYEIAVLFWDKYVDNKKVYRWNTKHEDCGKQEVTHWMPLPGIPRNNLKFRI